MVFFVVAVLAMLSPLNRAKKYSGDGAGSKDGRRKAIGRAGGEELVQSFVILARN